MREECVERRDAGRAREELLDDSATKGAIHAFTKSLARHLLDRGIRVYCVAPGPVWTPLNPADVDDITQLGSSVPMERPAQPEEIAPIYVTGEVFGLLGGKTRAG